MCVFSLPFFRVQTSLYVFRVLEVFRSFLWFLHELSLDKQKKNSLSLVDFIIHISDLSFSSLSKPHFTRVLVLWPPRESLFFRKKKEEHQKHPQSCVVLTLFSAKVRARFENERERERETESFFCDEREISVHLGS